jgi:hypothetical protein
MKYRKVPVVIDAWQWMGDCLRDLNNFCESNNLPKDRFYIGSRGGVSGLIIQTLEGEMLAQKNDWIIRGIEGEYYPCKPTVFNKTYEIVE